MEIEQPVVCEQNSHLDECFKFSLPVRRGSLVRVIHVNYLPRKEYENCFFS